MVVVTSFAARTMKLHCATSSSLARAVIVVAGASGAYTLDCLSQLDALCGGNDHGVQEQLLRRQVIVSFSSKAATLKYFYIF